MECSVKKCIFKTAKRNSCSLFHIRTVGHKKSFEVNCGSAII